MLDRNVQVMTYFFLRLNSLDQLICDLLRIAVLDTDPVNTWDLGQFMKKLWQTLFTIQVFSVKSCLLGNSDQLSYPIVSQFSCLS